MIDDLKPYPEYRDSGLPWVGRIPKHWEIKRGKALFAEARLPVRPEDQIVTCFRDGQVTLRRNRRTTGFMTALYEQGYQGVRKGQLVVHAMDAFAGAIGVSDSDGKCTPEYIVALPRTDDDMPHYYSHLLRHASRAGYILATCPAVRERAPRFRYSHFSTMEMPRPPVDEQTAIVRFLAWATGQVDRAILAKRKVIALLNEQKQGIVNRAVTQGLNSDIRMAPTNLPWLELAPSTWEVRRLKSFCEFVTSGSRGWARYYADAGPLFLRIGNISTTSIDLRLQRKTFVMPPADAEGARTRVLPDDILLSITAQIGAVGLVPSGLGEAYVNQHTALIRLRGGSILPRWVAYSLLSEFGKAQCRLATNGGTKVGLTLDDVRCLNLLLPEMEEQQAIVNAIDSQTRELDAAIAAQTRTVERLRDYRERLIADAVTGQVDVCAVSSSLPEVDEAVAVQAEPADLEDADEEVAAA